MHLVGDVPVKLAGGGVRVALAGRLELADGAVSKELAAGNVSVERTGSDVRPELTAKEIMVAPTLEVTRQVASIVRQRNNCKCRSMTYNPQ